MSHPEPDSTRGVRNPKIVDLITLDEKEDTVVLQMIEDRAFGSDPDQIVQLEEKFNNYIDYVLDGWMIKQYPDYEGKPVRIELLAAAHPDERFARMLAEMTRFADRMELTFRVLTQQ